MRNCTQGVSRCFLSLNYALDGKASGKIKVEMNWVSNGEGQYLVLSHIREKILQVALKIHPDRAFSFVSPPWQEASRTSVAEYTVPNLFKRVCE